MVKIAQAYREIRLQLSEAGIDNASFEVDLLLKHVVGKGRFEDGELTKDQWERLCGMASKRAKHYPLQYLLGSWPFMDLQLAVGPGVLIPRPETETVCLEAAKRLRERPGATALDLCAGTGALALGLASLLPSVAITAVELEEQAFAYLQQNVEAFLKTHSNPATTVQADIFTYDGCVAAESIDLIVSNPPYVTEEEYETLEPELYFEPKRALVAAEKGLSFYSAIAKQYYKALKPGGFLVFEIGSGQAAGVTEILMENGYINIEVVQDLSGLNRVVVGMRPCCKHA